MLPKVEIHTGGKLFYTSAVSESVDVTDKVPQFLFEEVAFTEGVTLRDVFLLIRAHIDLLEIVIGNWVREIVSEGLDKSPGESGLDYLELWWDLQISEASEGRMLSGFTFPDLSGIGPDDQGEAIQWSVSFTPANQLINLPIRLNRKLVIFDEIRLVQGSEYRQNFQDCTFTLGQVLYGLIWELSYHGDPKARDKAATELNFRVQNLDKEDLIPFDEIKDKILAELEGKES